MKTDTEVQLMLRTRTSRWVAAGSEVWGQRHFISADPKAHDGRPGEKRKTHSILPTGVSA